MATHRFLRHLAVQGHDVTVYAARERSKPYQHEGVHVETGLRGRSHAFRLAADADVLLSHWGDAALPTEVAAAADIPHARMVHGYHADGADTADLLVFNSHAMHDHVTPEAPSVVCHPPVDPTEHRTDPGEATTIVNCSRAKGIQTAARAAELAPAVPFLGVQGGYGQQIVPRASNFEVISSTGDMREVWARTRILLMPSAAEAWGMVGVEAMASGIPVIAHPTPGLTEALGTAGIFVDRDDPHAWADQIVRLQAPDEYAEASKAARARSAELDPADSLDRFTEAIELLVHAPVRHVIGIDQKPAPPKPPRYAVIGTGRSGTGYMAKLLGCGHEQWWNPHGRRAPDLDGDASWLALPSIEAGDHDGPVLHITRHPIDVVRSLVGIGFFDGTDSRDRDGAFRQFAVDHEPEVDVADPVVAAVEWWARWNERCAAVAAATVKLEGITAGRQLDEIAEVLDVPVPDPDGVSTDTNGRKRSRTTAARIWRLLDGRADVFGYRDDT